jgi:predicted metal-dependent hydrolase
MTEFKLGKLSIPYCLKRSEVATRLHIEMTLDGMSVTAPNSADAEEIDTALYRKRRWIVENHTDLQVKHESMHKIARFRTGAKVPYWGRLTRLETKRGAEVAVSYSSGFLVELPEQDSAKQHDDIVENALRVWMRDRLVEDSKRFCRRYAARLETDFSGCRVSSLRTRWGSCGSSGVVSLDWHLVFGPKRVLEYVVAHELCHRVQRNHSDAFWRVLRSVFGDYEHEHEWLMRNEHMLGYKRIPVTEDSAR